MKPTFHVGGHTRRGESRPALTHGSKSPVTDWSFQASAQSLRGGGPAFGRNKRPSLRRISEAFFAGESKRNDRLEAAGFVAMIAMAVWPIGLAIHAALALVK
jgi:hypothetical protein